MEMWVVVTSYRAEIALLDAFPLLQALRCVLRVPPVNTRSVLGSFSAMYVVRVDSSRSLGPTAVHIVNRARQLLHSQLPVQAVNFSAPLQYANQAIILNHPTISHAHLHALSVRIAHVES
jgi:hypothetical protein